MRGWCWWTGVSGRTCVLRWSDCVCSCRVQGQSRVQRVTCGASCPSEAVLTTHSKAACTRTHRAGSNLFQARPFKSCCYVI